MRSIQSSALHFLNTTHPLFALCSKHIHSPHFSIKPSMNNHNNILQNQNLHLLAKVTNDQQQTKAQQLSANLNLNDHYQHTSISAQGLQYHRKRRNFVEKLYLAVSFEGNSSIISWLPNGRCWIIHDKHKFINLILSTLCESAKWKSFLRQLSGWGFKRGK